MLARVGITQSSDGSMPGGRRGCYIGDGLCGDRRSEQSRESDLIPVNCAYIVGGISADIIGSTWHKAGHRAGKGTWRADRAIHSLVVQERGIGVRSPDTAVLGGIRQTRCGDCSVTGGGCACYFSDSLGCDYGQ